MTQPSTAPDTTAPAASVRSDQRSSLPKNREDATFIEPSARGHGGPSIRARHVRRGARASIRILWGEPLSCNPPRKTPPWRARRGGCRPGGDECGRRGSPPAAGRCVKWLRLLLLAALLDDGLDI